MKLKNTTILAGIAALMMGVAGSGSSAHAATAWRHGGFYGRDFAYFGPHDRALWAGGHWFNDWHGGRFGWWWVADGFWYFYPEPIYPYPTYVPPAIIVQQPPPMPTGLPPATSWYFCNNPRGYYPYVASCKEPWSQVPATPAPATPK
jgi:hypothetical protein